MADYMDEENEELKKLQAEVHTDTDNFENWEKLLRTAEGLEGGLNRNSNPQAIASAREIYDRFLAKFPLLFGYWKKYADLEFSIAGTEAAELVYERGVASITNSVDLWTNYCAFKVETSHDPEVIREDGSDILYEETTLRIMLPQEEWLFERGSQCVGLDFLAHPFWDKYIEFEERMEAPEKIFGILGRVIQIPMHQYARYFERYRQMAHHRPLSEVAPTEVLAQLRAEVLRDVHGSDSEVEREIRNRVDAMHLETFTRTQTETTRRWTYEQEIKRPYFHVTELDENQLANWRKYLDFEEAEGEYGRAAFLYERCLITCAQYDEFWLRYARWMLAQDGKEEEVRNIYQRASTLYVPIAKPTARLQYAYFEEMCGRVELAKDIHRAMLITVPGHVETVVSLANLSRRHGGLDAAIQVYKEQIDSSECDIYAKAALVAEWARLLWKIKGSVEEARQVFQKNQQWYPDSVPFWSSFLRFEIEQPTDASTEPEQYKRIKAVHEGIRTRSSLTVEAKQELSHVYMHYLLERGNSSVAKEYMQLDRIVNGPPSVQSSLPSTGAENGHAEPVNKLAFSANQIGASSSIGSPQAKYHHPPVESSQPIRIR